MRGRTAAVCRIRKLRTIPTPAPVFSPMPPSRRKPAASPRSKSPRRPAKGPGARPRITWTGHRPGVDAHGQPLVRHFKLETLGSAVEAAVEGKDLFILPGVGRVLGPGAIVSLEFALREETNARMTFRLRAANTKGKSVACAFVVAKQEGALSKQLEHEYQMLAIAQSRAPEWVVKPLSRGVLRLRGRPRTPLRTVNAMLREWPTGYQPLGIDASGQFTQELHGLQRLSLAQTEAIKGAIVTLMAKAYDPVKRDGIGLPGLADGELAVHIPKSGAPRIKLLVCRRIVRGLSPAKLVSQLALAHWTVGGRPFRLAPAVPGEFLEALTRAVGPTVGREWLRQYRAAVVAGKLPPSPALPSEALDALGIR